jgi:hypothetical protein
MQQVALQPVLGDAVIENLADASEHAVRHRRSAISDLVKQANHLPAGNGLCLSPMFMGFSQTGAEAVDAAQSLLERTRLILAEIPASQPAH